MFAAGGHARCRPVMKLEAREAVEPQSVGQYRQ